jgi:hypothetical protein
MRDIEELFGKFCIEFGAKSMGLCKACKKKDFAER